MNRLDMSSLVRLIVLIGSVNEDGEIKNADPIAIKFESALDSCSIKIYSVSDNQFSFTGLLRACHKACRL